MKYILLILILIISTGCAAMYESKQGNLRALTVARNIYRSNCLDCDTLAINAEAYQSGALTGISDGFFGSIVSIVRGLLPRGIPSGE